MFASLEGVGKNIKTSHFLTAVTANKRSTTMTMAPRSCLWTASLGILSTRAPLFARGFTPSLQRIHVNSCIFQDKKASNNDQTPPPTSSVHHSSLLASSLMGGDYAGLSATFSAITGELIPVPEYLVPKVLLEWGQGPSCLEVIVSEDVVFVKKEQS